MKAPNSFFDFTFDPDWSDQMKLWMDQFKRKQHKYTTVDDMDAFDGSRRNYYHRDEPGRPVAEATLPLPEGRGSFFERHSLPGKSVIEQLKPLIDDCMKAQDAMTTGLWDWIDSPQPFPHCCVGLDAFDLSLTEYNKVHASPT